MVMLPDSVRNYMTKFLNDDWMFDNGFIATRPEDQVASDMSDWYAIQNPSLLPTNRPYPCVHLLLGGLPCLSPTCPKNSP